MQIIQRLWQTIESIPGPTAVTAQWQELLGIEYEFARQYLRPTIHLARSFPQMRGTAHSPPYSVVEHGPGDYVGVCPNGGDAVTLAKQDLVIYELDRRKLQRTLAEALGVDYGASIVHGAPCTERIGNYRPCAGYDFPVYMTIPLESSELTRAVHAIHSAASGTFLLLAPTSRRLRPDAEAVIRDVKACFLPLRDAVGLGGHGEVIATPSAIQSLDAFRTAHLPAAEDNDGLVFFPTHPNAKWSDLRIRLVDGHTAAVSVGEASQTLHYAQMGMANKKNARPTVQWALLYSFAKGYGTLSWDHADASRKNQKRRENLSRDLTRFFRIEGDPIAYDKDGKGWRTLFTIEPDV